MTVVHELGDDAHGNESNNRWFESHGIGLVASVGEEGAVAKHLLWLDNTNYLTTAHSFLEDLHLALHQAHHLEGLLIFLEDHLILLELLER